ncbi:MAG: futalosine hydrolase [Chitinophagaceae bacterium]|nr:MAG: futalosine hydrolase [Chitinophagaceae bacterium]
MPRILLCAATPFEIAPLMEALPRFEREVDVLLTGVGLMETAFALAGRLSGARPELLLQAGIAGCLDGQLPLGHTVAVSADTVGDLGVWEGGRFRSTFSLGFGNPDHAPWTGGWLLNRTSVADRFPGARVKAVSVNQISTSPEQARYYREELGAVAESMEGAAFHYAALSAGIPFLQLRSFSNYIGERDKSRWKLRESITDLNETLLTLIPNLLSV